MKNPNKLYLFIGIAIILGVIFIILYNQIVVKPYLKENDELKEDLKDVKEENIELKQNLSEQSKTIGGGKGGYVMVIIILVIVIAVLIYGFVQKNSGGGRRKEFHEIRDHLRGTAQKYFQDGYAFTKQNIKLYKQYFFKRAWYKKQPYALITFSTLESWGKDETSAHSEPKKQFHYGYFLNTTTLEIDEIFPGWYLSDMLKELKNTRMGMEGLDFEQKSKESPMEIAMIQEAKASGKAKKMLDDYSPLVEAMKE